MRREKGRIRIQDLGVPSGALDHCATRPVDTCTIANEKHILVVNQKTIKEYRGLFAQRHIKHMNASPTTCSR